MELSNKENLNAEQWGKLYNSERQLKCLLDAIIKGKQSCWTKEMLRIASPGSKTLEIGSGSGQTSLCLSQAGCDVTVLDYSDDAIELALCAANALGVNIRAICQDARRPLPFKEKEFDIIFHAGLLEHFNHNERVKLLKQWKPYCKLMVSMIPNAASLCYRIGKENQENNGTWPWGREDPDYTQIREFMLAGYNVLHEYTIGEEHAINFLELDSPFKELMAEYWKKRHGQGLIDNFHQGYLLVTVGV